MSDKVAKELVTSNGSGEDIEWRGVYRRGSTSQLYLSCLTASD